MNTSDSTRSLKLLRLPAVMDRVGLRRTSIYKLISAGTFPAPKKIGRASLWVEYEVDQWIHQFLAGGDE